MASTKSKNHPLLVSDDEAAFRHTLDIRTRFKDEQKLVPNETGLMLSLNSGSIQDTFNFFIYEEGDVEPSVDRSVKESWLKYGRLLGIPQLIHLMYGDDNSVECQNCELGWDTSGLDIVGGSIVSLIEKYIRLSGVPCDEIVSSRLVAHDGEGVIGSLQGVIKGKKLVDTSYVFIRTRTEHRFVSYLIEF